METGKKLKPNYQELKKESIKVEVQTGQEEAITPQKKIRIKSLSRSEIRTRKTKNEIILLCNSN